MTSPTVKQPFGSFTDVTALIEEVKKHSCLWNRDDETNGDRYEMATAWCEVADNLCLSSDICRAKWRNLRDTFRREMRRNPITNVDDYKGTWRYFNSLWFLFRPGDERYNEDENPATIQFIKYEPKIEQYLDEEDPMPVEDSRPRKRRKPDSDSDSDVLFLKSLAPFLRQLDPMRNLIVRNKIQEVLINELSSNSTDS